VVVAIPPFVLLPRDRERGRERQRDKEVKFIDGRLEVGEQRTRY